MASFFFLVHSETVPTEYIPTRPFRVNAGALHSYILGAEGKTRYLSELRSGDKVQLVGKSGSRRDAIVGRIKMERRPLVMIEAECDGQEGTAMLQNAETIRLVRPDGTPRDHRREGGGRGACARSSRGQGKALWRGGRRIHCRALASRPRRWRRGDGDCQRRSSSPSLHLRRRWLPWRACKEGVARVLARV